MTAPMNEFIEAAVERIISGDPDEQPNDPNAELEVAKPEPDGTSKAERRKAVLAALYGDDFPGVTGDKDGWAPWAIALWRKRRTSVQQHLYRVWRNRLFRAGIQWIDSTDGRTWVQPPKPKDAARLVFNMVDKALDQRLQILTEQRPGFSIAPTTQDPDDKRKAQARQLACEYQYDACDMPGKMRESAYWAQTDGVSFIQCFWNPDKGKRDEALGGPVGDLDARVLRVEQVRVSPEATANIPPSYMIVRDVISTHEAVARYGYTGVQATDSGQGLGGNNANGGADDLDGGYDQFFLKMTNIGEGDRLVDAPTVDRYHVFIAPNPEALPNGLEIIVVGNTVVVGPKDLTFGIIPVVRVPDGSTDPSYFCRPTMEGWLDSQTRMNALISKWVENIRLNSGGRFLARANAITTETFYSGLTSLIEIKGTQAFDEIIKAVPGFSVGIDVKEAFALEKQKFEDDSGYNPVSRGQVTGESGRAIIASREQLERIFAPPVQAMARAFTDWARVSLAIMKWGYSIPRTLGVTGKTRPDLAAEVSADDLDGAHDVKVEPATMMPMPLSFRLYMLDNWLASGVIDMREYRRRQLFAVTRDIASPDEDQEARAKRITDAMRRGGQVPEMLWQDNEAIHQDVLEREIILQDDLPPEVRQLAQERWFALGDQANMKQMMQMGPSAMPPGDTGAPPTSSKVQNAGSTPASQIPLAAGNPPMGAAPLVSQLNGTPDAELAARALDSTSTQ